MGKGERTKKQRIGAVGESVAERFLVSKGYIVLSRNFRRPWGEIDIIAEKGKTVRFVEVKTVSSDRHAHHEPEEMVDDRKLRKLAKTAQLYMEQMHDSREFQIDVVGVILNHATHKALCRLFEQAL